MIFSIIFIQSFYFILKSLIYKKYYLLNKKIISKQNGKNVYKYNISYIKKIKKVVYSVIIGDYDKIPDFSKQKGYNYFLFSDKNYKNTNWTIMHIPKLIEKMKLSKVKMTRYIKLFPHLFFKDYELSIYIDATFIIIGDLNELLLRVLNPSFDLYFIQHPVRNKIFQEFKTILRLKKENKKIISLVRKRYIKENFPDNLGLTENNIIIRRHNKKKVINLMKAWWNEIKNYSYRDQLSLSYAIWKLNMTFKIYYLPKRFMTDYLFYREHSKIVEY